MAKAYDRAYFDRWYRGAEGVKTAADLERRVRLAVAAAEMALERPIRTVLDVGCGEGAWQPQLVKLRPRVRYLGVDPSDYAVRRFGRARNLLLGDFGALGALPLDGPYDLVVCADVLHYVPSRQLAPGLERLAALATGILYLETFTREDEIEGDLAGFQPRSAAFYRAAFDAAGLTPLGMHCWAAPALADTQSALERLG